MTGQSAIAGNLSYNFTLIPPPNSFIQPGETYTGVNDHFGINNAGQSVGDFQVHGEDGDVSWLRDANGTMTHIIDPDARAEGTVALGINNNGQVFGEYYGTVNGIGSILGFVRDTDGTYHTINIAPVGAGAETSITSMNAVGQMLVYAGTPGTSGDFYLINQNHSPIDLSTTFPYATPGNTHFYAINDLGQSVGYYDVDSNIRHAFIREADGTYHLLSGMSEALGINNEGQIVGTVGINIPAIYESNGTIDIIPPYNGLPEFPNLGAGAFAINDQGDIAGGMGRPYANYPINAFVATQNTVPEPSTFALLGFGGIGLAIRAFRRKRMAVV